MIPIPRSPFRRRRLLAPPADGDQQLVVASDLPEPDEETHGLTSQELGDLQRAVVLLEQPRLAVRLAKLAGKPLDGVVGLISPFSAPLHSALHKVVLHCLEVAIDTQGFGPSQPSRWLPKTLTGLTGGVAGLFGPLALPVELPVTTTVMLRAIADIARHNGEDLRLPEPRLACLQVFALGSGRTDNDVADYFATRATLNRLSGDVVAGMLGRTATDASAPVVSRLAAEIVSRFGLVWSERLAAGAVPLLGALSGASLNMLFMGHFERVATGHFTIRRLERLHGREAIGPLYAAARSDPRGFGPSN